MLKSFTLSLFLLLSLCMPAQALYDGIAYLKDLHQKQAAKPCKCYTFSQKNTHYKNDTVSASSEWHEKIVLPDFFRIQFGEAALGNYVVFKNDSLYSYKGNALAKSRSDSSSLLLILGGMYYRPIEEVIVRLKNAGFACQVMSPGTWQGEEVWILGEEGGNQIYFSKNNARVLRILEKLSGGDAMDMRFEAYQQWCDSYVETKVSFRRNGHLEQVEEYYDLRKCEGN